MGTINKPNLVYPLAVTFNQRGVVGTNFLDRDQVKKNWMYEVSKNPMTDKGSLALTKRTGAGPTGVTYGTSTQEAFLIIDVPGSFAEGTFPNSWVFSTRTGSSPHQICVSDGSTTTTIASISTGSSYFPVYVEKTLLVSSSIAAEYVVLQTRVVSLGAAQQVYYATSIGSWTQIVDSNFTSATHRGKMEFMDGYAFIMTSDNKIINSDLNSLATWSSTNFITKQSHQDSPVGLAKLNNQILAFGESSVEVYFNAGNANGSPLTRITHLAQNIGMASGAYWTLNTSFRSSNYYAVQGNHLYFVGHRTGNITASTGVYMYDGSNFEKISSSYIDKMLINVLGVYSVGVNGHDGIAIETINLTNQFLIFFTEFKEWFLWSSTVFRAANYSGIHLPNANAVDQSKAFVFTATDTYSDDTSVTYSAEFVIKIPSTDYAIKRMPMFGVEADTAASTNNLTFRYSDDDSSSYAALATIDLSQQKKLAYRGGAFRERHIQIVSNNDQPVRLHHFLATIK